MSAFTADYIREKLSRQLGTTYCQVTDMSDGCGGKFNAIIVTSQFDGKGLLERQRMVNAILEEEMKVIHAFTQKTMTPEQWAKKNSK
jgi:stress-induced morphogen